VIVRNEGIDDAHPFRDPAPNRTERATASTNESTSSTVLYK
jgi:hypothetical protein